MRVLVPHRAAAVASAARALPYDGNRGQVGRPVFHRTSFANGGSRSITSSSANGARARSSSANSMNRTCVLALAHRPSASEIIGQSATNTPAA